MHKDSYGHDAHTIHACVINMNGVRKAKATIPRTTVFYKGEMSYNIPYISVRFKPMALCSLGERSTN